MENKTLTYEEFNDIRLALLKILNTREYRRKEPLLLEWQEENTFLDSLFWRYFSAMSKEDQEKWKKETDFWQLFPLVGGYSDD